MVIDISEIIEIKKHIEWLEQEVLEIEPDDMDYNSVQFEINCEYDNLHQLVKQARSGG